MRTLYAGSAGIAIFQLELHKATGSAESLAAAVACGQDLVSYVKTKDHLPCAMFTGWAVYAFVFTELFRQTAQTTFSDAATLCLQRLADQSSELGGGRGWIEPMPFSDITGFTGDREIYDASVGAAGAGMVYLYFIIGELACGNLTNKNELLMLFRNLPRAVVASHEEVMTLIEQESLMGRGMGVSDC